MSLIADMIRDVAVRLNVGWDLIMVSRTATLSWRIFQTQTQAPAEHRH